jgi:hypothetical protein
MAITDQELAIAALKRLKLAPSMQLALQSMIPAALSNLAKQTARDPKRRNLLSTDPSVVELDVANGLHTAAVYGPNGSADLTSIVETYGVMLDTLQYGSVFFHYEIPFASSDVQTGSWPSGGRVEFFNDENTGVLSTGDAVYLTTTGTVPSGVQAGRIYYAIVNAEYVGFADSKVNALAGTGITLSGAGTGNSVINTPDVLLQWLKSPNQGLAETCLPFSMLQGWLEGYTLKLKGREINESDTAKLTFNVPYMPKTLADLPAGDDLHQDLLDSLVGVAATMGIQDVPPSD